MSDALPAFLARLIDNPPAAGGGIHSWMFDVARNLHAHMPAGQIEALLRSKLATCGRPVPDRELKAAIKNAMDYAWQPKGSTHSGTNGYSPTPVPITPPPPPKPQPDLNKIAKLLQDDVRVADLFEASPFPLNPHRDAEAFIDHLFPGNPLLCCGRTSAIFATRTRDQWRGALQAQSFLVPSPMTAPTGVTKDGKVSAHTVDNTGPRRFLVIEFDFAEFGRDGKTVTPFQSMLVSLKRRGFSVQDLCSNLLLRLNRAVPMTIAVNSGGKSIHGWFYCAGQPEANIKRFHDYAITLGADPVTWRPSQFVRMPDGTRENGNPQPVLYFNPATVPHGTSCL